jgi:molybdopterin/thiamine biosynthesis adenylyltransferase
MQNYTENCLAIDRIAVVGCGGTASYLLPPLLKVLKNKFGSPDVVLFDGDVLEERNLDRQLFNADFIGRNKADAMDDMYRAYYPKLIAEPEYFHSGLPGSEEFDLIFCCADNQPARREVLAFCDNSDGCCPAIIGGNEYTDAEAYYYDHTMQGTQHDPRKYYPNILTGEENDPRRPESCTGTLMEENPQLAISNFMSAGYMLHLFWFHFVCANSMRDLDYEHYPVVHRSNFSRLSTSKVKDYATEPRETTAIAGILPPNGRED